MVPNSFMANGFFKFILYSFIFYICLVWSKKKFKLIEIIVKYTHIIAKGWFLIASKKKTFLFIVTRPLYRKHSQKTGKKQNWCWFILIILYNTVRINLNNFAIVNARRRHIINTLSSLSNRIYWFQKIGISRIKLI